MIENYGFILCTREEFKDWLYNQKIKRKITSIQNHHTYSPSYKHFNGSNHFKLLQGMKNFHMKDRGFSDIAQHFTTFNDGTIAICRSLEIIPAGIFNFNTGSICIEHLGNFDIGGDVMTEEHNKTIVFLNAVLCDYFKLGVNKNTVVYHSWFNLNTGKRDNDEGKIDGSHKSCSGSNFFGGNSLVSAEKNFYPLIKLDIEKLQSKVTKHIISTIDTSGYPVLKVGSKGEPVKILQLKLKSLGYKVTVDGKFGKYTEQEVKKFQSNNNLVNDGIVGAETWNTLLSK